MAIVRFNEEEKKDVRTIKCVLKLYDIWRLELEFLNELTIKNNEIDERVKLLENQILFIEKLLNNSNLTQEEKNIINDALVYKKDSIEYIGRRYYYSESGLRNRVNIIIKKILIELYKQAANLLLKNVLQ